MSGSTTSLLRRPAIIAARRGPTRARRTVPRPAWARLAGLNTVLLLVFAVLHLIVLIYGCVRARGLDAAWILYQGPCSRSKTINLFLHLLLNVFSTLILASSNYFMQILNAPSRVELDRAHARSGWVNIGAPSMRNFLYLGPVKFTCWLILACSSVPIHLFFNSLVFQAAEVRSGFGMTIAAESFVKGAQYYEPGASLWNTAVPNDCSSSLSKELCKDGLFGNGTNGDMSSGIIDPVTWMNKTSEESLNISRAASEASTSWQRLDPADCRSNFLYCDKGTGLKGYRSVLLVVNASESGTSGWKRDEVFPNMTNVDAKFWDDMIPAKETNSLWYYEYCNIATAFDNGKCHNSCKTSLGFDQIAVESPSEVDPKNDTRDSTWSFSFWGPKSLEKNILKAQMRGGFDVSYNTLNVSYCLAEKEEQQCKIGVPNLLLLVALLCVLVKLSQCIFVMVRYVSNGTGDLLVTPGDAIKSLICRPDPTTTRMCTLEMRDVQFTWDRLLGASRRYKGYRREAYGVEMLHGDVEHEFLAPQARQWKAQRRRFFRALPINVWLRTYAILLAVLIAAIYYFYQATGGKFQASGAFGSSGINSFVTLDGSLGLSNQFTGDFVRLVLLANIPQLILSISYLQFNSLITKIFMAKEWAQMSTEYRPLRVTEPQGDQVSTYRLQLPYRWGVPCILASVLLHWLASSSCYVFMADGGFYGSIMGSPTTSPNSMGLSGFGFIAVGYSTIAIMVAIVVFAVVICVPLLLSMRRLPGDMVIVGSNSLAIAAACHVSKASKVDISDCSSKTDTSGRETGMELTIYPHHRDEEGDDVRTLSVYARIAESKVKWGVVRMEDSFYNELKDEVDVNEIGHLSFGVQDDAVGKPEFQKWYI
ncbi:hypothetical protein FOBRF1_010934 [Fusarium oxysporum]